MLYDSYYYLPTAISILLLVFRVLIIDGMQWRRQECLFTFLKFEILIYKNSQKINTYMRVQIEED